MSDPKYVHPYPAQGYYQGPPVMAPPPQYHYQGPPVPPVMAPPPQYHYQGPPVMAPLPPNPPKKEPGFLDGCLAALHCCSLIKDCCCDPADPSTIFGG